MEKEFISSPIKLTIGILISNRIQFIRDVMEGIKPLLNTIPSELIAIDTKGADGDGSITVVKEYTEKIYPFVWCNDFSKARNTILEYAQGEWFLALDDDEVLDNTDEIISFFQSDMYRQYNSASFILRNYDADGNYTTNTPPRLFRRYKDTRYIGAVHECINNIQPPTKSFSTVIHHYGYAFKTLEEAKKHQERNVSILNAELQHSGYTPHLCAQMTQELIYLETSTEEGLQFAQKALASLQATNQLKNPSAQYIMFATVLYHLRKQEAEEALQQIQFLQNTYPLSEITRLVFSGISASIALNQKDVINMLQHALDYIELWDWKQIHPDEAEEQTIFNFSQYYTTDYYYKILHIGAAAANELEYFSVAKAFWDRFPWGTENFDLVSYQQDLRNTVQGCKRFQTLQQKYVEIKQQFELLEQAVLQLSKPEVTEQPALIAEFTSTISQLSSMILHTLQPLLNGNSRTLALLENSLTNSSFQDIIVAKHTFFNEAEAFLSKNTL